MIRRPPRSPLFPSPTLFRSLELTRRQAELSRHGGDRDGAREVLLHEQQRTPYTRLGHGFGQRRGGGGGPGPAGAGGQEEPGPPFCGRPRPEKGEEGGGGRGGG